MEDRIRNVEKDIHNIYKILHGNGQEGITTKVVINTRAIEKLIEYNQLNDSVNQKMKIRVFEIVFKAFVMLAFTYIALQLGIKT